VGAETPSPDELRNRYLAVGSDWHRRGAHAGPLKVTAAGATAVHLAQLVHSGSDVAAVALSRYYPHDAAAGLVIAAAAGCGVYPLGADGRPEESPRAVLPFLAELAGAPDRYGPPVLIALPVVAEALRSV
jgi:fructose-1,6-bisphosphatase/inositol monophosphatase family enzyme